ncbi:MAG: type II toxin-antitoxin system Phd/YefM family antitoxin [Spirochaetota bacterium]
MEAVSYSDLRKNLKKYMDDVYSGHYPLIITRKNDENVVMLSLDEFNALQETNYLLATKANEKHLKKSIAQHKSGKLRQLKIG